MKKLRSIINLRRRSERGYVFAMTAIILLPLLAVSAMATDLGAWYSEGTKMQKAADAAALAGVVWLPDLVKATEVANETAVDNGFDNADPNITVTVAASGATELIVTIEDNNAPLFFSKFFLNNMTIERQATSQYVLPVPLGSPRNYFGTGPMVTAAPEGFYASINGYCAPKEQGDPFAPRYQANAIGTCSGTQNPDYIAPTDYQYKYIIEVPESRPAPLVVSLYSPDDNTYLSRDYSANVDTEFRLGSPDNTPYDNEDNPLTNCVGSGQSNPRLYVEGVADNDATMFGNANWSRFCTIPTSAPAGRYVLSVRTRSGQSGSDDMNSYSILASYNGAATICDSRSDSTCPRVSGDEWISIFAAANASNARFFLAEIDEVHEGKQMEITLFDPGEGGNSIRIIDPSGSYATFTYETLDGVYSGGPTSTLDVSGNTSSPLPGRFSQSKFNERFVVLTIDLPSDFAAAGYGANRWWEINYNFNSNVTDRSTWSVRIIGDPVHLNS